MHCPHCGKPNDDVARFCTACGKPLAAVPSRTPAKSSGVAVVLSFFWTGLGQMYNGQIGKGIVLMILQLVLLTVGALTLLFGIGIILLIAAVVLWAWNLFDAYNTAERINRGEAV